MDTSAACSDAGQSGLGGVASLATALRVGEEVFREALQKAPTLPKLADVGRAPATLADAIVARDAKEEERRRREAVRKDVKVKGKQVTPVPPVVEQAAPAPTPGLHIGDSNDASAFWMFAEVTVAAWPDCDTYFSMTPFVFLRAGLLSGCHSGGRHVAHASGAQPRGR
jgi:hypothetical protein